MRKTITIIICFLLIGCLGGNDAPRISNDHVYDPEREERIKYLEEKRWILSREEQNIVDYELNHLKGHKTSEENRSFVGHLIDSVLGID